MICAVCGARSRLARVCWASQRMSRPGRLSEKSAKISRAASSSAAGTQFLPGATAARGGEFDIIARDGATLVFVEVKAREGREFGDGGRSGHRAQAPADGARSRSTTWRGTSTSAGLSRAGSTSSSIRRSTHARREPDVIDDLIQNAFDA